MGFGLDQQFDCWESEADHDALYGRRSAPAAPVKPYACPICGKKKATVLAVLQHAHEGHQKPAHIETVAAWWVERAKEKAQREPGQGGD